MIQEIEKYIINLLHENFNITIQNPEQDYFSAGLDSFSFINFINEIETKYKIKFLNDYFLNRDFAKVSGLAAVIFEHKNV